MKVANVKTLRVVWRAIQRILFAGGDSILTLWLALRLAFRRMWPITDNAFTHVNPMSIPVCVINLEKRPDRLKEVVKDLKRVGFQDIRVCKAVDGPERYPGLVRGHAANLGCTLSHHAAIAENLGSSGPVAICEDDNQFLTSPDRVHSLLRVFLDSPEYDVMGLSVRVRGRKVRANNDLEVVSWALAPAFYVVKPRAKRFLIRAYEKSERRLSRQQRRGPFDQVWRSVQRTSLIFAIPNQRLARQKESFSDIQGQYFSGT